MEFDELVEGLAHVLKAPDDIAGNAVWAISNLCRDSKWCTKMLATRSEWFAEVFSGLVKLTGSDDEGLLCDFSTCISLICVTSDGLDLLMKHPDWMLIVSGLFKAACSTNRDVQVNPKP